MQDLVAMLDAEVLMEETTITTDKTDMLVCDLDAFGKAQQPVDGVIFYIYLKTLTTITAAHYFTPTLYDAAAKTSTTALTSGAVVTAAEQIPETLAVIDDTAVAGTIIVAQYRGVKDKVQLQLLETGTASMVVSVMAVGYKNKQDHVSMY